MNGIFTTGRDLARSIATQIRHQRWYVKLINRRTFLNFLFPTIIIFVCTIYLVQEEPVVGAALLGAGPPIIYAIYKEVFNQPSIKLQSESEYYLNAVWDFPANESDNIAIQRVESEEREQMRHTRHSIINPDEHKGYVYPYIDVYLKVKNIGNKTAKSCSMIVSSGAMRSFFGRWQHNNDIVTDIRPEEEVLIAIFRFTPLFAEETIDAINKAYSQSPYNMSLNLNYDGFGQLGTAYFDAYGESDVITTNTEDFLPSRPNDIRAEHAFMHSYDQSPETSIFFYGTPVQPQDEYSLELSCSADNWSNYVGAINLSIQRAVKNDQLIPVGIGSKILGPLGEVLVNRGLLKDTTETG